MRRLISILVAALCLIGCSESSESLNDIAQGVLQTQIQTQSQGKIHLASFQKTDGQDMEVMGVKVREIKFEATIEFNAAGHWLTGGGYGLLRYEFELGTKPLIEPFASSAVLVSPGSLTTISGTMEGRKTDNGWQFEVVSSSINPGQLHRVSQ